MFVCESLLCVKAGLCETDCPCKSSMCKSVNVYSETLLCVKASSSVCVCVFVWVLVYIHLCKHVYLRVYVFESLSAYLYV